MTTDDLLALDDRSFAETVSRLPHTSCELHLRALLEHLGGPSYEDYMWCIMKVVEEDESTDTIMDYYLYACAEHFPELPKDDVLLGRLAALAFKMLTGRVEVG